MSYRTIHRQINSRKVNMGGHIIEQPLPFRGIDQIDPFLLIHHWESTLKGGKEQRNEGVGPHPHRGFSPVTFIYKGGVHHRDSTGQDEVVYEGGTQWMFSGNGIVHSERPPKEIVENGGELEFIQFWVNAPSKNKMDAPDYKPLKNNDTPRIEEEGMEIGVVAGEFESVKGPIQYFTDLLLLRLDLKKGVDRVFEIPHNHNTLVYFLNGSGYINSETSYKTKDMVWFNQDGNGFELQASEDTRAIVLSGVPMQEPVVSYGPFVMNSTNEIEQAINDYQMGKMGVLVEKFN